MRIERNAFGEPIRSPLEALRSEATREIVLNALRKTLAEVSIHGNAASHLIEMLEECSRCFDMTSSESRLQKLVSDLVGTDALGAALHRRAELVARQVRPYVVGPVVWDIGCGDGLVSECLWSWNPERSYFLADVTNYIHPEVHLPFQLLDEGERLPIGDASIDTALVLTVLHHAADPLFLVKEMRRAVRHRAVVIESVIGVGREAASSVLGDLCVRDQMLYAEFLDWWYNRVFHCGVRVPFNFTSAGRWRQVFEETGWSVIRCIDLGIDQPLVPEHHVLFVLDAT